ncbi:hypothetical protein [Paenibacillus sp. UASWS1643]|uniref:hypothetical protein n=1 Tax=Paenibacillus sp. UASWS1643 TaxID=2580422 RepID=UPI00123A82B9|nr:hypothetical protein [Paenibacillus sp. UASWS1643]KAA8746133.1 hypothetical protein FE296_30470 [Paenibacillus sp. UASWS1643]
MLPVACEKRVLIETTSNYKVILGILLKKLFVRQETFLPRGQLKFFAELLFSIPSDDEKNMVKKEKGSKG